MKPVKILLHNSIYYCMKIKVCGLRDTLNIAAVAAIRPDYLGFIFYPGSKRYVRKSALPRALVRSISCARKVGVFVNSTKQEILTTVQDYNLNMIQLHGAESPDFCASLNALYPVIKSVPVSGETDFNHLNNYEGSCSLFLFDTATQQYGGSGYSFDWNLLHQYTLGTPFLLAGGIGPGHSTALQQFHHPSFYGIDLNSRFETAPGRKNTQLLKAFIHEIQNRR